MTSDTIPDTLFALTYAFAYFHSLKCVDETTKAFRHGVCEGPLSCFDIVGYFISFSAFIDSFVYLMNANNFAPDYHVYHYMLFE
jgi:hypothetical protein